MAGGQAQRRRLKNFMAAKEAKSRQPKLPPPPEEVARKQKRRKTEHQGPASFQKMMKLKAVAAAYKKQSVPQSGPGRPRKGTAQDKSGSNLAGRARDAGPDVATTPTEEAHRPEASLFRQKALKPRKKEFLKRKKLRKKGGSAGRSDGDGSASEDGSDVEDRVMTDLHKPAFGEQAMQPIKLNLKRKHWAKKVEDAPEGEAGGKEGRLQGLFQRQMQQAEARHQELERNSLAKAFREKRRKQSETGVASPQKATLRSLAALVQRNEAAAARE